MGVRATAGGGRRPGTVNERDGGGASSRPAALSLDRRSHRGCDARGKLVVPHGYSVSSYHFGATRHNPPLAGYSMMAREADHVQPMFHPQLIGEPIPENGRMRASALDGPGFGVELNRDLTMHRPFEH